MRISPAVLAKKKDGRYLLGCWLSGFVSEIDTNVIISDKRAVFSIRYFTQK
jgi:hypothetical protein